MRGPLVKEGEETIRRFGDTVEEMVRRTKLLR